ncbi:MAG: RNA polymerase sigma factor [Planctomycetes bacterium]|nr:RNA polymerase sigma factor [Planctomycetota bacterium]
MVEAKNDDIELMLRVRDHDDKEAFEALYEKYFMAIVTFLNRKCRNEARAHEMAQDTFMRLWRGRKGYDDSYKIKFSTYLYTIATNHFRNELDKDNRRVQPVSFGVVGQGADAEGEGRDFDPEGSEQPILKSLADSEALDIVIEAVGELDEAHRVPFKMARFEGIKFKDIAETLGIPEGTVKSRVSNAEKKVWARVQKYFNEE